MIKKFGDYATTQSYADYERLPKGGYVLKILNVETCEGRNGGEYLKIACDIEGGDYHHFYQKEYKAQQSEDKKWHCNYLLNIPKDDGTEQDGWTKRRFKTFTEALEESNPGYHFDWDEQKFKGKLIGGLFNEREYETTNGQIRRATNLAQVCTVEKIQSGDFKIPEDKLLAKSAPPLTDSSGFMSIPDDADDDMPFN